MSKKRVLFVCIHNSARSQMAEAFLNHLCGEEFEAHSAGLEPGRLNPVVVEVMREIGFDISRHATKSVFDLLKAGKTFSYVISVCDEAAAERCPVFPGAGRRIHWSFRDPSSFTGSPEERLAQTRAVRDSIKQRIETWCREVAGEAACCSASRT